MEETNDVVPLHALAQYVQSRSATRPMAQEAKSAFAIVSYRTDELHRHDYFEIYVLDKGSGVCIADGTEIVIGPQSVFVVPPGTLHRWLDSDPLDGYIARIPLIEGHALLTTSDIQPEVFKVRADTHPRLMSLFDWIVADDPKDDSRRNPISRLRWQLLFECLSQDSLKSRQAKSTRVPSDVSTAFMSMLERKFHLRWGVQDYANALKISRSSLLRATQSKYGCSPADLIQQRTLKEAERLLVSTDSTCAEISESLGFLSQAQFTRAFASRFKEAPTTFRRNRLDEQRAKSAR